MSTNVDCIPYNHREVVWLPMKNPGKACWDALTECVYGNSGDSLLHSGVDLMRIINANSLDDRVRVECKYSRQIGRNALAIVKLWFRTAARLRESGYDSGKTWKMRNCPPSGIRFKRNCPPDGSRLSKYSFDRICGSRICPWCHNRRSYGILRKLGDPHKYSIGLRIVGYPSNGCLTGLSDEQQQDLRKDLDNIRRKLPAAFIRSTLIIPEVIRNEWIVRNAYITDRRETREIPGVLWKYPGTPKELLKLIYPYPPAYLMAPGNVLACLLDSARNIRNIVSSRAAME